MIRLFALVVCLMTAFVTIMIMIVAVILIVLTPVIARRGNAGAVLVCFPDTARVVATRNVQPHWCVTKNGHAAKYAKQEGSESRSHGQRSVKEIVYRWSDQGHTVVFNTIDQPTKFVKWELKKFRSCFNQRPMRNKKSPTRHFFGRVICRPVS